MRGPSPGESQAPREGRLVEVTAPGDGQAGATLAAKPGSGAAYVRVLAAIGLGIAFGALDPERAVHMKPLGDGFVRLVKMVIAPIIFATVVHGIASMRDLRKLGRVGAKALVYFEVVTTLALLIGLGVVHLVRPGEGLAAAPLDAKAVESYRAAASAAEHGTTQMLLDVIPESAVGAFAKGEVLPVLLLAILTGLALSSRGEAAAPVLRAIDEASKTLFALVGIIMKAAPLGAFGAMSYTVGKFGLGALANLAWLMGSFYVTAALFVLLVLGAILRVTGLSIIRLLRYIADEILLVLATSSSESALPHLMAKLVRMGCSPPVVGLVVPTGYSFNLDGTSIYLTMATVFVAQATGTVLTWQDELSILGVLLLTSKGAAGVTGSGFVTLAGTLEATRKVPVAGLSLLLGIDRFMSEARAIVNLIGNAVATIVIAWWEGELDEERAREALGMDRDPGRP